MAEKSGCLGSLRGRGNSEAGACISPLECGARVRSRAICSPVAAEIFFCQLNAVKASFRVCVMIFPGQTGRRRKLMELRNSVIDAVAVKLRKCSQGRQNLPTCPPPQAYPWLYAAFSAMPARRLSPEHEWTNNSWQPTRYLDHNWSCGRILSDSGEAGPRIAGP